MMFFSYFFFCEGGLCLVVRSRQFSTKMTFFSFCFCERAVGKAEARGSASTIFHKNDGFFFCFSEGGGRCLGQVSTIFHKNDVFFFLFAKSSRRYRPWSAQFPTKMKFFAEGARQTFLASAALLSTKMSFFSFFLWVGRERHVVRSPQFSKKMTFFLYFFYELGLWSYLRNFPQKMTFFLFFLRKGLGRSFAKTKEKPVIFFENCGDLTTGLYLPLSQKKKWKKRHFCGKLWKYDQRPLATKNEKKRHFCGK